KGKSYTVLVARYSGRRVDVSSVFRIVGKLDVADGESVRFINKHIRNLENKSRADDSAKELLNELRLLINDKN
ncbi:MAG: hypothetical protein IJ725_05755, partial [Ruminococcus sp.]|nr:hypothetical protein [Ruminococcus sp.]